IEESESARLGHVAATYLGRETRYTGGTMHRDVTAFRFTHSSLPAAATACSPPTACSAKSKQLRKAPVLFCARGKSRRISENLPRVALPFTGFECVSQFQCI
ncbi:hypothetical protein WA026_023773, partial [Henosepilachna vigintioctopunctata]